MLIARAKVDELTAALEASDDIIRELANTYTMETSEGRRVSLALAIIIAANSKALAANSQHQSTQGE